MLPISLVLALTAAANPLPNAWATFSRSGALSRVGETVDIATGDGRRKAAFPYMLRLMKTSPGADPEITWADDVTCPAVRSIVTSMQNIRMPSPSPYGVTGQERAIIVDGTQYYLSAPSSDSMGRVILSSNVGSPLAAWIDGSLKQLAPCWKRTAS